MAEKETPAPGKRATRARTCPKCGKKNPIEAVLCRACYTTLNPALPERATASPASIPYAKYAGIGLGLGIMLFVFGGPIARRLALQVLGVGVTAVLMDVTATRLRDRRETRKQAEKVAELLRLPDSGIWHIEPATPPSLRWVPGIANAALFYGLEEGAETVRISVDRGAVSVDHEIGGVWHGKSRLPRHVWEYLHQRIRVMAGLEQTGERAGKMKVQLESMVYEVDYAEEGEDAMPQLMLRIKRPEAVELLAA
jgi:ribosomal protein L40E